VRLVSQCPTFVKAQIPLGSSHHVTCLQYTTRSTCQAHAFWLRRACRTTRLDTLDTSNASCRVETRRAKWNLGLIRRWPYLCRRVWAGVLHFRVLVAVRKVLVSSTRFRSLCVSVARRSVDARWRSIQEYRHAAQNGPSRKRSAAIVICWITRRKKRTDFNAIWCTESRGNFTPEIGNLPTSPEQCCCTTLCRTTHLMLPIGWLPICTGHQPAIVRATHLLVNSADKIHTVDRGDMAISYCTCGVRHLYYSNCYQWRRNEFESVWGGGPERKWQMESAPLTDIHHKERYMYCCDIIRERWVTLQFCDTKFPRALLCTKKLFNPVHFSPSYSTYKGAGVFFLRRSVHALLPVYMCRGRSVELGGLWRIIHPTFARGEGTIFHW